ncbi:hypothetical protein CWC39_02905 [Corynebacterium heidelbergense]|uniref:Uncharacterized protein n=1 Tax=Corynebacterium heidelbergense TaxID=2055947 RepID=A0A364VCW3_9CORY|nr:hypothetical protein CWC39_02905 [Corynebacterium heidelbergense]
MNVGCEARDNVYGLAHIKFAVCELKHIDAAAVAPDERSNGLPRGERPMVIDAEGIGVLAAHVDLWFRV